MQKKEEISFEYKKKNVEENESLKEENKRLEKELEELEDKYALLLEENARYFNLIALLKKENRELAEKKTGTQYLFKIEESVLEKESE